jgi:hypothetical protein
MVDTPEHYEVVNDCIPFPTAQSRLLKKENFYQGERVNVTSSHEITIPEPITESEIYRECELCRHVTLKYIS